jgi:hypothetical protein
MVKSYAEHAEDKVWLSSKLLAAPQAEFKYKYKNVLI